MTSRSISEGFVESAVSATFGKRQLVDAVGGKHIQGFLE
jgi:hypothetical protein